VWVGTQQWLVNQALATYYNAKIKKLPQQSLIGVQDGAGPNAITQGLKRNVWEIDDPGRVRIKTRTVQKYTIYNTGSTIGYLTKIDAKAKRHLSSSYAQTQAAGSQYNETAFVLTRVADELKGLTPAGNACVQIWEPMPSVISDPWAMPSNSAIDPSGATNLLSGLRQWHAREQFMPWVHNKRTVTLYETSAPNRSLGPPATLRQHPGQVTGALGFIPAAPAIRTSGLYVPSVPLADSAGTAVGTNWSFDSAWRAYGTGAPAGMTLPWANVQDRVVPAAGTDAVEAFRLYPEYREARKGIMDRFWRRKSRRLPPLLPGSSMSFKVRSGSTIAPWRMGIPGKSDQNARYSEAMYKWGDLTRGSPFTTIGMGFATALSNGGGAPAAIVAQTDNSGAALPMRYVYNKRTDPMGSPGTSGVTTLVLRGNTVPHVIAPPGTTGAYTDAGPAQILVKRETFWRVKMYLTKRSEREQPYMVQNDATYDTDETKFLNFFKTSPAQSAGVTFAQI